MKGQLLSMDFMVGVVLLSVVLGSLIQYNEFMQNDFKQYQASTDHSTRVLVDAFASSDASVQAVALAFYASHALPNGEYCFQCVPGVSITSCSTVVSACSKVSVSRRIVSLFDCATKTYSPTGQTVVLEVWKCG